MKLIFLNTYIIAVKETSKPSEPSAHYLCLLPLTLSTGFKKQDGGYESNLESHIWDSESCRWDGIRENPVYRILHPAYGILGFTV